MLATLALAGCGTPPAKDFGGRWKPVNRFQDAPTEIPLAKTYTYYAAPMDGTLKNMLSRWAKDSGVELNYQLQSDFTLYKATTQVQTTDIQDAATRLNSIYASQDVFVSADGRQILVRPASAVHAEAAAQSSEPAAANAPAAAGAPAAAAPAAETPSGAK
jgi:hypothetical protein